MTNPGNRLATPQGIREEAAIYNPAFIATAISAATRDYEDKAGEGMPFALAFVAMAMCIPGIVRSTLPQRTNAYLSNWVGASPLTRSELVGHAKASVPYVREAIRFGLRHGYFVLHEHRISSAMGRARIDRVAGGEATEIIKACRLVGRWLAKEEPAQVFAQVGLRP